MTIKKGSKVAVKNQEDILSYLEREGFNECVNGNWRKCSRATFYSRMFNSCNKEFTVTSVVNNKIVEVDGEWFDIDWLELV